MEMVFMGGVKIRAKGHPKYFTAFVTNRAQKGAAIRFIWRGIAVPIFQN